MAKSHKTRKTIRCLGYAWIFHESKFPMLFSLQNRLEKSAGRICKICADPGCSNIVFPLSFSQEGIGRALVSNHILFNFIIFALLWNLAFTQPMIYGFLIFMWWMKVPQSTEHLAMIFLVSNQQLLSIEHCFNHILSFPKIFCWNIIHWRCRQTITRKSIGKSLQKFVTKFIEFMA